MASFMVDGTFLEGFQDWEAVLARHALDLRPALASKEVLRLRLVSHALRRAYGQLVGHIHITWPWLPEQLTPASRPPMSQPRPPRPTEPGIEPAAPELSPLARMRAAFPQANHVHLNLDILAMASEGLLQETSCVPRSPAAVLANPECPVPDSAAASEVAFAAERSRFERPHGTADAPAGAAQAIAPEAATSVTAAEAVVRVLGTSHEGSTPDAAWAPGGSNNDGVGGGGLNDPCRPVDGVWITARLPMDLQFGGRVLSTPEQQRLKQVARGITARLLQPHPLRTGDLSLCPRDPGPTLARAPSSSMASGPEPNVQAQISQPDGLTGTFSLLAPRLSCFHLELPVAGGGAEELRCMTPQPVALAAALLQLPRLKELSLAWPRIDGVHLAGVVALPCLRSLSLADDYENLDGWLGACRAALPLALGLARSGASLPGDPDDVGDFPGSAAAATGPAAGWFSASFALPLKVLPARWHPGLLALPAWLPVIQQLRLRSPSIALYGHPPWLVRPLPEPPALPGPAYQSSPQQLQQPADGSPVGSTDASVTTPGSILPHRFHLPPLLATVPAMPPLACLTSLEVGGTWPRRHSHQSLISEQVSGLLASLVEHALTASRFFAPPAVRGDGANPPNLCHQACTPKQLPQLPQLLLPTPLRNLWAPLASLSFQAERLRVSDWQSLRTLTGLRELRINGWTPGARPASLWVLKDVETEEKFIDDGGIPPEDDGDRHWRRFEDRSDGGEGVGCSVGAGGARGHRSCSSGGGGNGLLSLPRLQLLMLSLQSSMQLQQMVGRLPRLEVLHLFIKGHE
ncbi:hypothetical protein VaNZ11_000312, partial [Volvox africanus]